MLYCLLFGVSRPFTGGNIEQYKVLYKKKVKIKYKHSISELYWPCCHLPGAPICPVFPTFEFAGVAVVRPVCRFCSGRLSLVILLSRPYVGNTAPYLSLRPTHRWPDPRLPLLPRHEPLRELREILSTREYLPPYTAVEGSHPGVEETRRGTIPPCGGTIPPT